MKDKEGIETMEMMENTIQYPENPFCCGDEEFIWGVVSADDMSDGSNGACFYTMNDIDLTYNKVRKKFSLSIETIYQFTSPVGESTYLLNLLRVFTDWMHQNNHPTDFSLTLADVFHCRWNEFDTISHAYAWFKFMVGAFVAKFPAEI